MHKLALLCFNGSWYLKTMLIGSHTQKILKQYQDMGVDAHTGRDIKDVRTDIYIYIYILDNYIVYSVYGCVSLFFRTFQLNHKQLNHFNYITFGPLHMFKTIPTRMPWNLHTTLLPLPNCSHKISPNLISPPWDFSEISQGRSISKNTPVQNLSRQSPKMNTGKT